MVLLHSLAFFAHILAALAQTKTPTNDPECPAAANQTFTVALGAPNVTVVYEMACNEDTDAPILETKYVDDFAVCMEICTSFDGGCKAVTYGHANGTLEGTCQIKLSIGNATKKAGSWRAWQTSLVRGTD
jgi:hypothetical protein